MTSCPLWKLGIDRFSKTWDTGILFPRPKNRCGPISIRFVTYCRNIICGLSALRRFGSLTVSECSAKTLIRLCECTGWSESSLGAHAILQEMLCPGSPLIYFFWIWIFFSSQPWCNSFFLYQYFISSDRLRNTKLLNPLIRLIFANSVNRDQTSQNVASDQGLHCLSCAQISLRLT